MPRPAGGSTYNPGVVSIFMGLRCLIAIVLAVAWCGAPMPVYAHADLLERIAAVTEQITAHPDDPVLYLKRGELHRVHQDWAAALADYLQAERLAPDLPQVAYYTGRMWLEADRPELARPALDRFLVVQPHHADALLTRARALARLGERLAAAQDLEQAIAQLDSPAPEPYLERARLLVAEGVAHMDAGLQTLDAGIIRLGPLVTLIQFAIEVEAERGRYTAALARLESLPLAVKRQPVWLKRHGDLLRAAGREMEAQTSYTAALTAIEKLPLQRRTAQAMAELEAGLRLLLRLPAEMK